MNNFRLSKKTIETVAKMIPAVRTISLQFEPEGTGSFKMTVAYKDRYGNTLATLTPILINDGIGSVDIVDGLDLRFRAE